MKWVEKTLSEISDESAFGPRFSSDLYAADGNIATLRTTDISQEGQINYSTMPLAYIDIDNFKNHYLQSNDLVITRSGTIGVVALFKSFPLPVLPGAFLIRFRLKSSVSPLFYKYYFHSAIGKGRILSTATGAVQQNLNITNLNQVLIPYPPLSTQKKIASILCAYDDLIENNSKRIKLLEEAAEIIYKDLFIFFRPSIEVNDLPAGWKVSRADEIFKINIGKTPPREQEEWFNDIDSGIKWVSIKDINNSSVFIFDTNETVTESAVKKFNMNLTKAETVILSFKLTVGKVVITTVEMGTNEAIAHFNIEDESQMNNEFIYFYLKNFPYNSLGSTSSIGTAINSKIVKSMPVLLPPEKVIKEYGEKVRPYFMQIKNLLKQNTKLREARDILLPRLMSGEIEV
jgi:type I restriction enzyme, S subunit